MNGSDFLNLSYFSIFAFIKLYILVIENSLTTPASICSVSTKKRDIHSAQTINNQRAGKEALIPDLQFSVASVRPWHLNNELT